ncbi:hypothetical protein [Streptomyces sp. NPDC002676]
MDQGLAAALGASVGVAGTLGTAFLTYVAARRQSDEQAKLEHLRSLRAERREAYLAVFQAAESVDRAMMLIAARDDVPGASMRSAPDEEVLRNLADALGVAVHALYAAQARLALVGPDDARQSAVDVWAAARELRRFVEEVRRGDVAPAEYQTRCGGAVDRYEHERTRFANLVRSIMEAPPK